MEKIFVWASYKLGEQVGRKHLSLGLILSHRRNGLSDFSVDDMTGISKQ